MPVGASSGVPSFVEVTSFKVPAPEQMVCRPCGLTHGAAMAAPHDAMNHASTQRRKAVKVRRADMGPDDTGAATCRTGYGEALLY